MKLEKVKLKQRYLKEKIKNSCFLYTSIVK